MMQSSKNDRDDPCVNFQNKVEIIFKNIKIEKKIELLPYISSNISGTSDSNEKKWALAGSRFNRKMVGSSHSAGWFLLHPAKKMTRKVKNRELYLFINL